MQAVARLHDELFAPVHDEGDYVVCLELIDVALSWVIVKFGSDERCLHAVVVNHLSPVVVNLTTKRCLHLFICLDAEQGQNEKDEQKKFLFIS